MVAIVFGSSRGTPGQSLAAGFVILAGGVWVLTLGLSVWRGSPGWKGLAGRTERRMRATWGQEGAEKWLRSIVPFSAGIVGVSIGVLPRMMVDMGFVDGEVLGGVVGALLYFVMFAGLFVLVTGITTYLFGRPRLLMPPRFRKQ